MAVVVNSSPSVVVLNTISNGFLWDVTSDKIAEDNFRYTFRIEINGVPVGTKKVPSTGTDTIVDLEETIRSYITGFTEDSVGDKIWDITDAEVYSENSSIVIIHIFVGDQYELSGVIIASELGLVQYVATRGFVESGSDFTFASRFNGSTGNILRVVRGEKMFTSYTFGFFSIGVTLNVGWTTYDKQGTQISTGTENRPFVFTSERESIVLIPVGTANALILIGPTVYRVVYTFDTPEPSSEEVIVDVRITDPCTSDPVTLMFKNKFFQFSQFTFDAINFENVVKTRQQWESETDGIHDVNVVGRGKLTLKSTYITEDESADLEDLFLSDEVYIIPSGERVTIDQSSLLLKTQQRDKVIQYTFNIERSPRKFKP